MRRLAAGEDLQIIEILQGLLVRRRQVQQLEHVAGQLRRLGATGRGDEQRLAPGVLEDLGHFGVEGKAFAPTARL